MEFTSVFQVRFDECAAGGAARASTLLRYMIETAFAHSAAKGVSAGLVDWVFTDRQGSPVHVVPEIEQAFPALTERFSVQALDLGVRPADAGRDDYVVPAHQADPCGHMNTAAYLDLFEDGLAAVGIETQRRPVVFDLEFLRPILPGDTLARSLWAADGTWMIELKTREGHSIARGMRTDSRAGLRREGT